MKKAINLYFYKADTKEKLDLIKKAGFDGVILGVYEGVETMSLKDQVDYCNQIGLGISMIHCSYIEPKLNGLWCEDSNDGDFTEKDYIQQIEAIKDYGVKEVIIAVPLTPNGEVITSFINKVLSRYNIKITRIGFGLPAGSDLEYADELTIKRAFEYRIPLKWLGKNRLTSFKKAA